MVGDPRAAAAAAKSGWSALRAGRWDDAHARFTTSCAVNATGRALEGLSWSAWWRDDSAAMFSARHRAYRAFREEADDLGAARMAMWLCADELDFNGAAGVANGWLQRARRLLAERAECAEHGWLAFHEGFVKRLEGRHESARELGVRAAEIGRRHRIADLEMLGLALEGASLVAGSEIERGMRCLDEAAVRALQDEAEIPISGAWTCCFAVGACAAIHDFDRAAEWCHRIGEFAERYSSRYLLAYCRAEHGAIRMWHGDWKGAASLLERSVREFEASRPAQVSSPLVTLAELRRRQGRSDDARALLGRASQSDGARLCSARLSLDAGDVDGARDQLERLLERGSGALIAERAPALALLTRARLRTADHDGASEAADALRVLADGSGTPALRGIACAADGLLAAASGDDRGAQRLLADAVEHFERSGNSFESASARLELAASLRRLGRQDAASEAIERAAQQLRDLGVEAPGESPSSTSASLGDPPLSRRELDVVELLAEGLTNRQIAERLVLSEHTIHRHVSNLMRKLGAPSRAAAVARAAGAGFLDRAR